MWLVQKEDGGELVCAERKCPLPNVWFKGRCEKPWTSMCLEQGKGRHPLSDFQGNVKCTCSHGWIQGSDGNCHLLYTQGNCNSGQVMLTRAQALKVGGGEIPCEDGVQCMEKCEEMEFYNDEVVRLYDYHGHRCLSGGTGTHLGICCPNIKHNSSAAKIKHYIERFSHVSEDIGVCVNNPCQEGQILYHEEGRDGDNHDSVKCVKAEKAIWNCGQDSSDSLKKTEEDELYCCDRNCIETFSVFGSSGVNDCPRRYTYSSRRGSCVRAWG